MSDSQRIIRSYIVITGLYTLSASLIWGVNTLFLLDAGLDILGVFIANSVFTASMALFEIPTGVLADTRGRRVSFLLSVAIVLIGTLGYVAIPALGGGLVAFSLASVVLGLGYTFYSGAMEAWLVDALKATGFEGQLDRVFARASIVSGIAMLIGTTGGGALASGNLSIPFIVRAGLLAVVFVFAAITMNELGYTPRRIALRELPGEMGRVARASIAFGWREPEVRLLILANLVPMSVMAWGFYAWQPYFLELLGQNLTWVAGVIAALVSLSIVIGNTIVEWLARFCGRRTTLMLWGSVVLAAATLGVGLTGNFFLAVALYLVASGSLGVIQPVAQAYIHKVIPSEQRATVISFQSLVSSGGSMFGQSGLGYLSQVRSIASGYVVSGLFSFVALPVLFSLRGLRKPSDRIIGEAGKYGACAPQGLPNVAGVESSAPAPAGLGD